MKEVIKVCLDRYNNLSHSNDELSNLIIGAIKTSGWYLDLGDMDKVCLHNNDLNSNCQECDEEQARESWVCEICNESTYDVDYAYIGTGTNHLGCELEIEMKDNDSKPKIKPQEKQYTVVEDLGWDARNKKQTIIGRISESEYEWLIAEK